MLVRRGSDSADGVVGETVGAAAARVGRVRGRYRAECWRLRVRCEQMVRCAHLARVATATFVD